MANHINSALIRRSRTGYKENLYEKGEVVRPQDTGSNMRLLNIAASYWYSFSEARKRRRRSRDYIAGRQWSDKVWTGYGYMEEKKYIQQQGQTPLVNNVMSGIAQNILGQYRGNQTKIRAIPLQPTKGDEMEVIQNAIDAVYNLNSAEELFAKQVNEKILCGANIIKITYGYFRERDRKDIQLSNVDFDRIFFNPDVRDIRLWDINFIGELHDYKLIDILANKKYCKGRPEDMQRIRSWYAGCGQDELVAAYSAFSTDLSDTIDFYIPTDFSRCRVIEIWERRLARVIKCHDWLNGDYYTVDVSEEAKIVYENNRRLAQAEQYNAMEPDTALHLGSEDIRLIEWEYENETYWHVKHLTPNGHCLWEAEEPFDHQDHPYVVSLGNFTDGEVYGLAHSWIDQQRGINRNQIMLDMLIGTSAKNLFIISKKAADSDTPEEIADKLTRLGSVYIYNHVPGEPLPQFVSNNGTNIGVKEALALYLENIKSVSGVYGAIQGQEAKSGSPASLYQMEAQNSTINLREFFSQLTHFKEKCASKVLKLMHQFYKDKRNIPVIGNKDTDIMQWDPDVLRDVDADIKIIQSYDTPSYRSMVGEQVLNLAMQGLLPVKVALEASPEPWAKQALDGLNKWEQEQQAAQQTGAQANITPELQQQVLGALEQGAQGVDSEVVAALQQGLIQ